MLVTFTCIFVAVCEGGGFLLSLWNVRRAEKTRMLWLEMSKRAAAERPATARIFADGEWHEAEKVGEWSSDEWRDLKKQMN